jgi:lipopolysaccharide export system protein LptA
MAVLAIGVIATVAYNYRPREIVEEAKPIERIDPKAIHETRGGDVYQLKGARADLRLEFGRQVTYADGQNRLFDVKVRVDNRGNRNYVITGKEARIGKDESSFDLKGDVRLETSDGLVATADSATYVDTEKIVRAPGPVKYSRGRMSGTGVGFTFDEQRDVLTILDQAVVNFAPEGDLAASSVTAGTFLYARRDRYLRFERTMHMERDGQVIDAGESHVNLFPDRDEPDRVELRGNASVSGSGMGALRSMTARDINLDYGEDGRTLQNATLNGTSQITVATKDGSGSQTLAGEMMDIAMEPDGSVRTLATRERVVVTLPAAKDAPARTIRSNVLVAEGQPAGIRKMTFQEGVEYREAPVKGKTGGRVARAQQLEAGLEAASGALHEARFISNVDFTDGTLHATSAEARYMVAAGTLALFGKGQVPHIDSDMLTIDAETIDITLNPRTMTAAGKVKSVLMPAKKAGDKTTAVNRPGLLGDDEAVSIISAKLTYDEAARRADYSGQTTLIQGQTSITAAKLTLDDTKGNLTADGQVVTNLMITTKGEEAAAKPKPTIGRAESFAYSDQTRKATYTTAAQFDGGQGNLRANKLDLQLAKDDNALELLDATGQVIAVVDKRTITGARLTYSTSEEKYFVSGAPVRMVDSECQEHLGKTLTFWKGSDRVQIDGNNEVRTQTKGGGKCPATPPPQ